MVAHSLLPIDVKRRLQVWFHEMCVQVLMDDKGTKVSSHVCVAGIKKTESPCWYYHMVHWQ